MPRVKRGTKRRAKRKKILERASGYFLTKSKLYRSAKEAVDHSMATKVRRPSVVRFIILRDPRFMLSCTPVRVRDLCADNTQGRCAIGSDST